MIKPDDPRVTVLVHPWDASPDRGIQQCQIDRLIDLVDQALLVGSALPLDVGDTQLHDEATITRVAALYRSAGWDLDIRPAAGVLYTFHGKQSDRVLRSADPRVQSLLEARPHRIESPFVKYPPHDKHADATDAALIEIVQSALLCATILPMDIYETSYYSFASEIVERVQQLYEQAGWNIRAQPRPGVLYHIAGPRS